LGGIKIFLDEVLYLMAVFIGDVAVRGLMEEDAFGGWVEAILSWRKGTMR